MYVCTVSCSMRTARDEYDDLELAQSAATSLALYFILASGAGLLGFLGWLLTF